MTRTVHLEFPADHTVGYVHSIDARGESHPIGPARGILPVPTSAPLFLTMTDPQWMRSLAPLPPDALYGVHCMTRVEDEHLAHLARFTGLREINLSKAGRIGDAGIAHLARLTSLRELDLYRTRVTDAGLASLAGLVSLEDLHLGATGVRGHGIILLRHLPRLKKLNLHDTEVDDVDVQDAAEIASLQELVIRNTRVTLHGAAALRARRPDLYIHGAQTEEFWGKTLWFLACFVHRLRPDDPVKHSSSRGEMAAALNRAVGRGTEISAGEGKRDRVLVPAMDPDLSGAGELNLLLVRRWDARLRVRFADGGVREVPWLVKRGADRRQLADRRQAAWSDDTSEGLDPLFRRYAERRVADLLQARPVADVLQP
jgi:hypothetical protein